MSQAYIITTDFIDNIKNVQWTDGKVASRPKFIGTN